MHLACNSAAETVSAANSTSAPLLLCWTVAVRDSCIHAVCRHSRRAPVSAGIADLTAARAGSPAGRVTWHCCCTTAGCPSIYCCRDRFIHASTAPGEENRQKVDGRRAGVAAQLPHSKRAAGTAPQLAGRHDRASPEGLRQVCRLQTWAANGLFATWPSPISWLSKPARHAGGCWFSTGQQSYQPVRRARLAGSLVCRDLCVPTSSFAMKLQVPCNFHI